MTDRLTPEGVDSTPTPDDDPFRDDELLRDDESEDVTSIDDDDRLDRDPDDDGSGGEQLPDELMADAMGRPLAGPDDDQGMEHAGDNLAD
jgi:hypothetical protein